MGIGRVEGDMDSWIFLTTVFSFDPASPTAMTNTLQYICLASWEPTIDLQYYICSKSMEPTQVTKIKSEALYHYEWSKFVFENPIFH